LQRTAPPSTLFPYTTLFRSPVVDVIACRPGSMRPADVHIPVIGKGLDARLLDGVRQTGGRHAAIHRDPVGARIGAEVAVEGPVRSEEHTSELQSPCNIVCRL